MNAAELMNALLQAGDADGYNIDEHCYFYSQVTGTPCPPPENFGAGDRGVRYSVASFASLAAGGFDGNANGGSTSAPGTTIPVVVPGTGNAIIGGNSGGGLLGGLLGNNGGGGLGGILPLLLIGLIIWFLLD